MKRLSSATLIILAAVLGGGSAAPSEVGSGWNAYLASDYATAWRALKPLAEAGDPQAQYYLGTMYNHGHGAPRDLRLAATWYEKAARAGHPDAPFTLGFLLYYGGEEFAPNPAAAVPWLDLAAQAGNGVAQSLLARLYLEGTGVPSDRERALTWALSAAEKGIVSAQYDAAALLAARPGAPNVLQACKWLELAARAGYPGAAPLRDALAGERLTPDELAQARALADAWRAR